MDARRLRLLRLGGGGPAALRGGAFDLGLGRDGLPLAAEPIPRVLRRERALAAPAPEQLAASAGEASSQASSRAIT